MTKTKKCPSCGYVWTPRALAPVECPDCKARLRRFNTGEPVKTTPAAAPDPQGGIMKSSLKSDKAIPEIAREDLDRISPLHQIIAKELIAAGKIHLIEEVSAGG